MASKSTLPYHIRAASHQHPVAQKLFRIAEQKKSNLIISADFSDTEPSGMCRRTYLLNTLSTHVDIIHDFGEKTVVGLKKLAAKHNFMIFEDRKFVDIGSTVQKQYHGGALRISEWADIVNVSPLGGGGVVEALEQIIFNETFPYRDGRAVLLLAEMTTAGSLATGQYTEQCIDIANQSGAVIGFVATGALGTVNPDLNTSAQEDFIIFTTGVNSYQSGNVLGQQYQTPEAAVKAGSDFIIVGRGIYTSENRVGTAKQYQREGWNAYEARIAS
ncbi:unnamed protein product [Clonostachys chloroleuca]|uniref:Orotidine 5'-phosphate decarboxylase n=1 Tax=Clonostachys chloroleuca TaxID=1926264 RepID=A0AA35M0H4_9HYPO|nr:unnamed protein product [Clonostachys chloroleuca]